MLAQIDKYANIEKAYNAHPVPTEAKVEEKEDSSRKTPPKKRRVIRETNESPALCLITDSGLCLDTRGISPLSRDEGIIDLGDILLTIPF